MKKSVELLHKTHAGVNKKAGRTQGESPRPARKLMITADVIAGIAATAKEKDTMVMVVSRDNKWAIRKNGATKAYRILPTINEAIAMAKVYSRSQKIPQVVVSDKMGNILKIYGKK